MTRNVHSHGCGKISVALLGGAILAGAAYTEDPTILSLSVGQGVTNTLSQALAAYNTAQGTSWSIADLNGGSLKSGTLEKIGTGVLAMSEDVASFAGLLRVSAGTVIATGTNTLGWWGRHEGLPL